MILIFYFLFTLTCKTYLGERKDSLNISFGVYLKVRSDKNLLCSALLSHKEPSGIGVGKLSLRSQIVMFSLLLLLSSAVVVGEP